MASSRSNKKVANSLLAMSSAAVMAVYAAGYVRTRPAADRLAKQAVERSLARPTPADEPLSPTLEPPIGRAQEPAAVTAPPARRPDPKPDAPKPVVSPAPVSVPVQVSPFEPAPSPAVPPAAPVTPPTSSDEALTSFTAPPAPAPTVWKDGKYIGWGGSRHGDIQATVVIEGGRIVSAEISDCQTRYPCDVIDKLPAQVIVRQSPNVQRVSGATESADAFYSAVYFALKDAAVKPAQ